MITANVKEVPMVKKILRGTPNVFYINNITGLPKPEKLLISNTIKGHVDCELNSVNKITDTFWTSFDKVLLENIIQIKKSNNQLYTINE